MMQIFAGENFGKSPSIRQNIPILAK